MLLIASMLFFLIGKIQLSAQCIDSTLIQNGAYCDPTWIPVCACNGITYRSDCFARNAGVANNSWVAGICDPVDFDFNPNPAYDLIYIDAMLKNIGNMNVQLVDRFGQIFYSTTFTDVTEQVFQISVNGIPNGMYFIKIYCNDGMRVKKVVIPQIP